ncbi:hypothetical protein CHLNCDRAFT_145355 [Chlorella variabilis]|uniref:Uncharacterized protein n=1 Tax=Chlorella variabilis TaxID=554065 RepID=E1ZE89_CHLVA|nr:hypothetical protein CHLNCDRAFT_145355 [Chlorella variabilis]EFN55829.1 hypothetical protein CHLNCDRAFT_145355 [Chlorella variabilis]|eukprot:XP_005847931.1 hypothetical protein CHLNCDRAFT_145355 [Chlorella variabilis]
MGSEAAADCVMREVAARIIQHHFRERRKRPSASGSARWPATPPAPPASCSSSFARKASVLDFMPGPRPASVQATRAAASGRPFSPTARQLQMGDVRASASTEKMGHIMRMIAELEKQAVEEARQVAPPPAVPPPQPRLQAQQQEQQAKSPTSTAHPIARVLAAQALSIGSKQIVAAAATDPVAAGALRAAEASTMPPAPPAGQLNAAAVASSVRAKIQQLQQQVADKDGQLAELRQQAQAARREQAVALRAAEASHKAQLAEQKAETEASVSRSMQLIDRIMKDKDALSGTAPKCARLSADVGAMQAEAAKQIEALKEGLARELRKQKEVWVAAERAKREAWMAEQTRSIKESTIKGLEPEIQARRGRQWAGQRPNGMGSALAREQQG